MTEQEKLAAIRALQMMQNNPQLQQVDEPEHSEQPMGEPEIQDGNMLDKREAEPENLSLIKSLMFERDPQALLKKKLEEEEDEE